jgi:hypothetical protein
MKRGLRLPERLFPRGAARVQFLRNTHALSRDVGQALANAGGWGRGRVVRPFGFAITVRAAGFDPGGLCPRRLAPLGRRSPQSQVSRLCEEIDDKVKAFLDRPIEGDWLYLWIDATYVKLRQAGCIVSVAVIVAVDVNSDGRREILGLDIGPSEAETFWTAFLRKLARRGLRGVKLVSACA